MGKRKASTAAKPSVTLILDSRALGQPPLNKPQAAYLFALRVFGLSPSVLSQLGGRLHLREIENTYLDLLIDLDTKVTQELRRGLDKLVERCDDMPAAGEDVTKDIARSFEKERILETLA